jgi:hypothetical protein
VVQFSRDFDSYLETGLILFSKMKKRNDLSINPPPLSPPNPKRSGSAIIKTRPRGGREKQLRGFQDLPMNFFQTVQRLETEIFFGELTIDHIEQ